MELRERSCLIVEYVRACELVNDFIGTLRHNCQRYVCYVSLVADLSIKAALAGVAKV